MVEDAIKRKGELAHHKLIITGADPVPLEIRGPSNESAVGSVVERYDLRNTHKEAYNIIFVTVTKKQTTLSLSRFVCT